MPSSSARLTDPASEQWIAVACSKAALQPLIREAKTEGGRVLGLLLLQAIHDSASQLRLKFGADGLIMDYRIGNKWYECFGAPRHLVDEIKSAIYDQFGLRSRLFSDGGTRRVEYASGSKITSVDITLSKTRALASREFIISFKSVLGEPSTPNKL